MIPVSGIYPLQFSQSLPFRVTSNRALGFDSSMEEILWSVTADYRRITTPFYFLLYQHPSGVPNVGTFYPNALNTLLRETSNFRISEPTPSGRILASGNILSTDWINDVRQSLSGVPGGFVIDGLLTLHSFDSTDDVLQAWIGAKASDGGGNANVGFRTWTHQFYSLSGSPPFPFLGYSGQMFDIDLDEIFYHPIPRFCNFKYANIATSGIPSAAYGIYPIAPIFPSFAKLDGTLIATTDADDNVRMSTDSHLDHVGSGHIRIDGDCILPSGSFNFGGTFAVFVQSGIRNEYWNGSYQPMITRGFVTHGTITPVASKTVVPVVISHNGVVPSSGERISRYPAVINDFTGFYRRPNGYPNEYPFGVDAVAGPSGFEYFTDCLAIPTTYIPTSDGPFYGMQFLSPISSFPLWVRHGSGVNMGDSANYLTNQIVNDLSAIRIDSNTILSLKGFTAGGDCFFVQYDNLLETVDDDIASGGAVFDVSEAARIWYDGTSVFTISSNLGFGLNDRYYGAAVTTISGIMNSWDLPAYTNVNRYNSNIVDSSVNRRSCVGFYDGTDHYLAVTKAPGNLDISSCSGFSQLSIITGVDNLNNFYDYGPFEPITGTNVGLIEPIVPIAAANITSATDFNTGIWCIIRARSDVSEEVPSTTEGTPYLARLSKNAGEWQIQEIYASKKFPLSFGNSIISPTSPGSSLHFFLPFSI